MTYRCNSCGHIFEDGEQARWKETHGFMDGTGENWSGCPMCKGDFEETKPCKFCFTEHTADELFEGVCMECLRRHLTKEIGIRYILSVPSWIEAFGCELLDCSVPQQVSPAFRDLMHRYVFHYATVEQVQDFILDEDECCTDNFAEWLIKYLDDKEVEK